jgi:MFS family permease
MLGPLALAGHGWFLFNSMVSTVYVLYAVDRLHLGALAPGTTCALAGVGGVIGAAASGWIERRIGVGSGIIGCRLALPVGYALVPLAGVGNALVLLAAAQFVFGLTLGIENPLEMGYRQGVTPDRLQGRMNATMRSLNRAAVVVGAPAGGGCSPTTSAIGRRCGSRSPACRPSRWVCCCRRSGTPARRTWR